MNLQEFFQLNPEVAIAFSGGVCTLGEVFALCAGYDRRVRSSPSQT